jgi:hypothetical protein
MTNLKAIIERNSSNLIRRLSKPKEELEKEKKIKKEHRKKGKNSKIASPNSLFIRLTTGSSTPASESLSVSLKKTSRRPRDPFRRARRRRKTPDTCIIHFHLIWIIFHSIISNAFRFILKREYFCLKVS